MLEQTDRRNQARLPSIAAPFPKERMQMASNNLNEEVQRHIGNDNNLLVLICPDYLFAGCQLMVQTPDGRVVEAIVPDGVHPGQSFLVRLPALHQVMEEPVFVVGQLCEPTLGNEECAEINNMTIVEGEDVQIPISPVKRQEPSVMHVCPTQQEEPLVREKTDLPVASTISDEHELILVTVPYGTPAGTILQVQHFDRVIEATVPPGDVPEFYMRVPPRGQEAEDLPHVLSKASVQGFIPTEEQLRSYHEDDIVQAVVNQDELCSIAIVTSQEYDDRASPNNIHQDALIQAEVLEDRGDLVLVRVSENVAAGTPVHVDPGGGRVVEAYMPPGNLKEFYVRLPLQIKSTFEPIKEGLDEEDCSTEIGMPIEDETSIRPSSRKARRKGPYPEKIVKRVIVREVAPVATEDTKVEETTKEILTRHVDEAIKVTFDQEQNPSDPFSFVDAICQTDEAGENKDTTELVSCKEFSKKIASSNTECDESKPSMKDAFTVTEEELDEPNEKNGLGLEQSDTKRGDEFPTCHKANLDVHFETKAKTDLQHNEQEEHENATANCNTSGTDRDGGFDDQTFEVKGCDEDASHQSDDDYSVAHTDERLLLEQAAILIELAKRPDGIEPDGRSYDSLDCDTVEEHKTKVADENDIIVVETVISEDATPPEPSPLNGHKITTMGPTIDLSLYRLDDVTLTATDRDPAPSQVHDHYNASQHSSGPRNCSPRNDVIETVTPMNLSAYFDSYDKHTKATTPLHNSHKRFSGNESVGSAAKPFNLVDAE
jgi:hypothetical protein